MGVLRQIFICATPGEGRCGAKGGGELLETFREEVSDLGLPPSAVLRNVCTRRHEEGPVVFVFPDDIWYTRVKPEDVPRIVERHLARQAPVENSYQPSAISKAAGGESWRTRRDDKFGLKLGYMLRPAPPASADRGEADS